MREGSHRNGSGLGCHQKLTAQNAQNPQGFTLRVLSQCCPPEQGQRAPGKDSLARETARPGLDTHPAPPSCLRTVATATRRPLRLARRWSRGGRSGHSNYNSQHAPRALSRVTGTRTSPVFLRSPPLGTHPPPGLRLLSPPSPASSASVFSPGVSLMP